MDAPVFHYLSTIEVPVTDVDAACAWYENMLSAHTTWRGENAAMLRMRTCHVQIFLVHSDGSDRLQFRSRQGGVIHSVIDFYCPDLPGMHAWLHEHGVSTTPLSVHDNGLGGFGFDDPDGNRFGVTNVPFH